MNYAQYQGTIWHTQSELVTFLAQNSEGLNLPARCPYVVRMLQ